MAAASLGAILGAAQNPAYRPSDPTTLNAGKAAHEVALRNRTPLT